MTSIDFQNRCKEYVTIYTNIQLNNEKDNKTISNDDVYIVWYCKTLQNHEALLTTSLRDGVYYEITYNGDKNELYVDVYKKFENINIKL